MKRWEIASPGRARVACRGRGRCAGRRCAATSGSRLRRQRLHGHRGGAGRRRGAHRGVDRARGALRRRRGPRPFTLDGEEVDAPAGTLVFLRDPTVKRAAVALEAPARPCSRSAEAGRAAPGLGVGVLRSSAITARPGRGREGAIAEIRAGARGASRASRLLYHLACCGGARGRSDEALEHLNRAVELDGELPRVCVGRRGPRLDPRRSGFPVRMSDRFVVSENRRRRNFADEERRALARRSGRSSASPPSAINAWRSSGAGQELIEEHDEVGGARGRARGALRRRRGPRDASRVDGEDRRRAGRHARLRPRPGGPSGRRSQLEAGTTVLVAGGKPGEALLGLAVGADSPQTPTALRGDRSTTGARDLRGRLTETIPTQAGAALRPRLRGERSPAGREGALGTSQRAVELEPRRPAHAAQDDADLDAIRAEPRLPGADD